MSGNVETGASLTGVKNETPLMKTPSVVYGPSQYELLGQCWTLCKPFARVKGDRHCPVDGTDGFGCGRPRLLEEGREEGPDDDLGRLALPCASASIERGVPHRLVAGAKAFNSAGIILGWVVAHDVVFLYFLEDADDRDPAHFGSEQRYCLSHLKRGTVGDG